MSSCAEGHIMLQRQAYQLLMVQSAQSMDGREEGRSCTKAKDPRRWKKKGRKVVDFANARLQKMGQDFPKMKVHDFCNK